MLATLDTILAFVSVMLMMSMLVTVLVQLFNSALQRRGRNLQWALGRFLEGIGLAESEAEPLACALLEHSNVTDSGKRKAEALDPKTLFLLLEDLGASGTRALAKESHAGSGLTAERGLAEIARDALEKLRALTGSVDGEEAKLESARRQLLEGGDRLLRRFHMTMATATARFIRHTKWVAFGSALLLCGSFQIDSFALYEDLRQDAGLRTAYVAAAESRVAEAETQLDEIKASPQLAARALDDVLDADADDAGATGLRTQLRQLRTGGSAAQDPGLEDDWVAWLREHGAAADAVAVTELVVAYRTHLDTLLAGAEERLYAAATASLDRLLAQDTVMRPPARWQPWTHWRILGVLVTALLVSLGAPFWFNLLGNLVSLRPVLAKTLQKLDASEEKAARSAAGGAER